MAKRYALFEHTADLGIRAFGDSLAELYENAAWGLTDVLTDASRVAPRSERSISVAAADRDELLVRWLSELLYRFDAERFLFSRFRIDRLTRTELEARCRGETFDPARHKIRREIKAVTYHGLEVRRAAGTWKAAVIFDI